MNELEERDLTNNNLSDNQKKRIKETNDKYENTLKILEDEKKKNI